TAPLAPAQDMDERWHVEIVIVAALRRLLRARSLLRWRLRRGAAAWRLIERRPIARHAEIAKTRIVRARRAIGLVRWRCRVRAAGIALLRLGRAGVRPREERAQAALPAVMIEPGGDQRHRDLLRGHLLVQRRAEDEVDVLIRGLANDLRRLVDLLQ